MVDARKGFVGRGGYLGSLFELSDVSRDSARAIV